MISLPCVLSSSSRSESKRDTTAVEDIAAAPPSTRPACHPAPSAMQIATPIAIVSPTCAAPSPNTTRRIITSFGRLNSSPIENIRNTMPISARCRVVSVSGISASENGPSASPVTI
jgi:hypothetical protein